MPPECHGEAVANAQGNILGLTYRIASITSLDGISMCARMSENCGHFAVEKENGDQRKVNIAYRTRTQKTRPRQRRREGASFSGGLVKMNVEGSRECGQMNANARPQRVGQEGERGDNGGGRNEKSVWGSSWGAGWVLYGRIQHGPLHHAPPVIYSVILHVLGPCPY